MNKEAKTLLEKLKKNVTFRDKLESSVFLGPVTKIMKSAWEERVNKFQRAIGNSRR